MFIIKQKQLNLLAKPGLDEFTRQLRILVEEEYPEEVLLEDPTQVYQRLTTLIQKARQYGFVYEQQVALFVLFCMELGDDFDQRPENISLVAILNNRKLDPQTRIDQVGGIIFS